MFSENAEENCIQMVIFTRMGVQAPGQLPQHPGMHPSENNCTHTVFF